MMESYVLVLELDTSSIPKVFTNISFIQHNAINFKPLLYTKFERIPEGL